MADRLTRVHETPNSTANYSEFVDISAMQMGWVGTKEAKTGPVSAIHKRVEEKLLQEMDFSLDKL